MSSVSEWAPSEGVTRRLANRAAKGNLPQITVLPSKWRDGNDLYSETDLEALKVRDATASSVDFLDSANERRFLAEHSAEVALNITIGVAANIGSGGLIALAGYVVQRIRAARAGGTLVSEAIVEVRIAKIKSSADNYKIDGLQITAPSNDVARVLLETLAGIEASRELLRGLDEE